MRITFIICDIIVYDAVFSFAHFAINARKYSRIWDSFYPNSSSSSAYWWLLFTSWITEKPAKLIYLFIAIVNFTHFHDFSSTSCFLFTRQPTYSLFTLFFSYYNDEYYLFMANSNIFYLFCLLLQLFLKKPISIYLFCY